MIFPGCPATYDSIIIIKLCQSLENILKSFVRFVMHCYVIKTFLTQSCVAKWLHANGAHSKFPGEGSAKCATRRWSASVVYYLTLLYHFTSLIVKNANYLEFKTFKLSHWWANTSHKAAFRSLMYWKQKSR